MLNDLFDDQLNCLLTYENLKADIFDSIFRIIMNNAGLYLSDYFNQKVLNNRTYTLYIIYIYIIFNIENGMFEEFSRRN